VADGAWSVVGVWVLIQVILVGLQGFYGVNRLVSN